ncbi:hypothetical protein [Streptomyces narbonensis]|uniref:hypothetical protein n=1 Tax=Streptomyces narbonensis TaxID=67333 RepID=UPI0033EDA2C5
MEDTTEEPTRRLSVDLTVEEWNLLDHALFTAAAHYDNHVQGHDGTSDAIRALGRKITLAETMAAQERRAEGWETLEAPAPLPKCANCGRTPRGGIIDDDGTGRLVCWQATSDGDAWMECYPPEACL